MLYSAMERCLSGRKCRSRKAVGCKPSWVRIPLSPPGRDNAHLLNNPDIRIGDSTVMLSTCATLSVNSAKHLEAQADRPFAAAQGDTVRQLRLMRMRADKSAVGTINRPLHCPQQLFHTLSLPRIVRCVP